MRRLQFDKVAFEQYTEWGLTDRKTFKRIADLLRAIEREPFGGIGNPEPLKHKYAGCWSRRIDEKNRLIYQVTDEASMVLACRSHYGDK